MPFNYRVLGLGDNVSEVLSQERGRACDHALNAVCRRAAALRLACGFQWLRRYCESARNPSDHDSRLADRGGLRAGQTLRGGAASRPPPCKVVALQPPPGRAPTSILAVTTTARHLPCRSALPPRRRRARPGPHVSIPQAKPGDSSEFPLPPLPPRSRAKTEAMYFLEVFGGCCRLSGAIQAEGLRIAVPIEIENGGHFDVLQPGALGVILAWIRSMKIWAIYFGTPCTRWSVARTTGNAGGDTDVTGLGCALFTARVLRACRRHEVKVIVENPASSGLWEFAPVKAELEKSGCFPVLVDYDTPYKKHTKFITNAVGKRCRCIVPHERLQGLCHLVIDGRRTS